MRDPEIIETELMEISTIAEDTVKIERIVAWSQSSQSVAAHGPAAKGY
jgi:hypothetical protein